VLVWWETKLQPEQAVNAASKQFLDQEQHLLLATAFAAAAILASLPTAAAAAAVLLQPLLPQLQHQHTSCPEPTAVHLPCHRTANHKRYAAAAAVAAAGVSALLVAV
jgi:ABC-type branched-subunit amino acid transport system substrate-binding protein